MIISYIAATLRNANVRVRLSPPMKVRWLPFHHHCHSPPLPFTTATCAFHHHCHSPPFFLSVGAIHHHCHSPPLPFTTAPFTTGTLGASSVSVSAFHHHFFDNVRHSPPLPFTTTAFHHHCLSPPMVSGVKLIR